MAGGIPCVLTPLRPGAEAAGRERPLTRLTPYTPAIATVAATSLALPGHPSLTPTSLPAPFIRCGASPHIQTRVTNSQYIRSPRCQTERRRGKLSPNESDQMTEQLASGVVPATFQTDPHRPSTPEATLDPEGDKWPEHGNLRRAPSSRLDIQRVRTTTFALKTSLTSLKRGTQPAHRSCRSLGT
jgi:hypothetical protein